MTRSRKKFVGLVAVALVSAAVVGTTIWAQEMESESPAAGSKYLYISEFEIGPDQSFNEAMAECTKWNAAMPDFFDRKMKFGSHSDNLLTEIEVK